MRNNNLSIQTTRESSSFMFMTRWKTLFYGVHAVMHVALECVCAHEYCATESRGSSGSVGLCVVEGARVVDVDASLLMVEAD